MRLFDTTPRRKGNSLLVLLVRQSPQESPSPLSVRPPNAVTRSRREYHYSCFFHGVPGHHGPYDTRCEPLSLPRHLGVSLSRLLSPLCCSKTRLCNSSYWLFNFPGPNYQGKEFCPSLYRPRNRPFSHICPENFLKNFSSSTILFPHY